MNLLALIPLCSGLAIGFLAALIAAAGSRVGGVRSFLAFAVLAAYLSLVEFELQATGTTPEAAELLVRLRGLWPLAPALLLQFLLVESGLWKQNRLWLVPALHLPALLATGLNLFTDQVVAGAVRTSFGFTQLPAGGWAGRLLLGWVAGIGAAVVLVGVHYWRRAGEPQERERARLIVVGVLTPIVLGALGDGLLAMAQLSSPPISPLGALISALIVSQAMRQMSFLVVSPASAADGIISNMSDLLFLTDAEGRIVRTNRAALQILSLREEEVLGHPVDEVLPQLKEARARATSVKELEAPVLTRDRRSLILSLSTSSIRAADGRVLGMTFIGRDISDRKRVEEARQSLVRGMIKAQDEERRRVARELHDETGQVLGSLIAELRVLEDKLAGEPAQRRVSDLRHLVTMALQEIQRISRGMHPGALDAVGLASVLHHYAAEFSRLHEIKVTVEILGFEGERRLPAEVETTLYRVVQEALTNVARHSGAKVASLYLVRQGKLLRAIIEDDGKGFDPESQERIGGLGLLGIEERVSLLGGSVRLETAPGEGVTLKVEIPVPEPAGSPAPGGPA